jgi:hypothetical protein
VYGPVPTGVLARSSTPDGSNIAPMRVVIRCSQLLLGWLSVTRAWVGDTTSTPDTTPMPLLSETVQASDRTRSMLNFTSSAVNASPLENVTPSRSVKSYTSPSGLTVQDSASAGSISPVPWSSCTRPS